MILYHGQPNGPSFAVLAALEECGLDIECRPIDLLAGERHAIPGIRERVALDMAVEGEGPVLVRDGEAMTESVFLAQFFDEEAGGGRLQPKDPYARWQMMMWCRQVTERLAPAVALLGNLAHSRRRLAAMEEQAFAALTAKIASDDLRARWSALRNDEPDEAQVADSEGKIEQFADRIEDQLADGREWLMGSFSIADLETYGWMAPAANLKPAAAQGRPRLTQWLERVSARDGVRAALARASGNRREAFAPGPEINRWG